MSQQRFLVVACFISLLSSFKALLTRCQHVKYHGTWVPQGYASTYVEA
jgi:hypothetical protein